MATITNRVEDWAPPTESPGKVPQVTAGKSGGKDIKGDFPLDQIVIDQLPPGTQVHSCNRHRASTWTVTAKIETTLADGEPKFFFLKCAEDDQGKAMLEGEFHSMTELYKAAPDFVPKPHDWGKLNVSSPDTYFFLCDFIEMTSQNPDPIQLCTKLVQLHQAIPKILGPLEADGRIVKPCLIHGDLWDGNIGTDFETGEIYIFDASVYYAHNEMEIAMWRGTFNKVVTSKVYLNTYLARMGISEPAEQFDDRNRLYSCYMTLHESTCHNGSSFREQCYENMTYLINKYAPFPRGESGLPEDTEKDG
ncbi:uncharacterized protein BDZ99DRAFT_519318 [Mytilinidion resinicola]|uniref:protein-ribulosamine 3-kinase n=1 Tax=Mytilinidion resinicola TaxID=574789 RepID=A0A6A6YP20_9PEZI|nr:uncharacterized protein BDZ99DRAFT_519318 [Mytilinidion resinicola]KAF2810622.1 hypothetical protein BDZ99DRAFT_519318 [Mytilinidion resinicola]